MHYVIIGAGPAGVIAAETLRKYDKNSAITLIGDEPEPPYSRMAIPYLLMQNIEEKGTYLRKAGDHYQRLAIDLCHDHVIELDSAQKQIHLQNDKILSYDKLLIATGSHPVTPPITGMDLPCVNHCWTLADARQIAAKIKPGAKVVLMGAGFIGCIILEALVKRGAELTVVEQGDRMVPRMMNEKAGKLIKRWCIDKGIRVLTSTRVEAVEVGQTSPLSIKLAGQSTIPADLLVSATGVRPNIAFLKNTDIKTDQGIRANALKIL